MDSSETPSNQNELLEDQILEPCPKSFRLNPNVIEQTTRDIWKFLLAYRCINALFVETFFQPDEYFQSLEPAWQMAFGPSSGAWITWEWRYQLRSSLHPVLFASVYYAGDKLMKLIGCLPQFRATILSKLPNLVQAYFAAMGDYYTWKLSEKIYGTRSNASLTTFLMTVLSTWQWFCSTRTFSNCLETSMTVTALYFWPWGLVSDSGLDRSRGRIHEPAPAEDSSKSIQHLRISLLLAGTATVLRPTSILIWLPIMFPLVMPLFTCTSQHPLRTYLILLREAFLCAILILLITTISDRFYFRKWTFPPYQWLYFNLVQDLAIFYGRNNWHYYLSQGLPLLLTSYFPFTLVGLWYATALHSGDVRFLLTTAVLTMLGVMSCVAHKEVRFIYPLLPILHILAAPIITDFFTDNMSTQKPATTQAQHKPTKLRRKPLLLALLAFNITMAIYTTNTHQSGVKAITTHLREIYESQYMSEHPRSNYDTVQPEELTFAAFLMPCHSTPWRSHLSHANLTAWALTCEPPIYLPADSEERARYRDEADRFFDDPVGFLRHEIGSRERPWPRYVVGFEDIQAVIKRAWEIEVKGEVSDEWVLVERKRVFNSHWHDDPRRRGDVIIWEIKRPGYQ